MIDVIKYMVVMYVHGHLVMDVIVKNVIDYLNTNYIMENILM